MEQLLGLAAANLLSPVVLFFVLGLGAALLRSDLEVPQAVAKALALYLMLAIGFKGGVEVAGHGPDFRLLASLLVGIVLSFLIPIIAFALPLALTFALLGVEGAPAALVAALAAASASLGVLIERWLFFAEAKHTVTLYYGAEAA